MSISRRIMAFGLAGAVICSCTEAVPEPVGNNGRDDSFYKVKVSYAGALPVSGEPLKASNDVLSIYPLSDVNMISFPLFSAFR